MASAIAPAFAENVAREYERNGERYAFLRWGQKAFDNFRVVPPGTGICHQVNLEYLAQTVWTAKQGDRTLAYPDTLVGTDSHTTMVNGLAVLGWGVGGIEAEAAMLGQPISMLIPEVIGFKLTGKLKEGATATDLVLTVTQMLRKKGVVGKFVEFYGPGLDDLTLADRATIANMAPEYGATCGFFPIDDETIRYLKATGRSRGAGRAGRGLCQGPGPVAHAPAPPIRSSPTASASISARWSRASPGRSARRTGCPCRTAAGAFTQGPGRGLRPDRGRRRGCRSKARDHDLGDGDVVIAAITSCTNTSNPSVMLGAGLIARNAVEARAEGEALGQDLAGARLPGGDRLSEAGRAAGASRQAGLQPRRLWLHDLHRQFRAAARADLGRHRRRAISRSARCSPAIAISRAASIRRPGPITWPRRRWSSPMRWPARMKVDLLKDPLGIDKKGKPVYLADLWPSNEEIADTVRRFVKPSSFRKRYADVFAGDRLWRKVETSGGLTYGWDSHSTYVQNPPYFVGMPDEPERHRRHRGRAHAGLAGRQHHHRPHLARRLDQEGRARPGQYLIAHGVPPAEFNSYGARRGNHEVMMRGTFANIRLKNEMLPGTEGGITRHLPDRRDDVDL